MSECLLQLPPPLVGVPHVNVYMNHQNDQNAWKIPELYHFKSINPSYIKTELTCFLYCSLSVTLSEPLCPNHFSKMTWHLNIWLNTRQQPVSLSTGNQLVWLCSNLTRSAYQHDGFWYDRIFGLCLITTLGGIVAKTRYACVCSVFIRMWADIYWYSNLFIYLSFWQGQHMKALFHITTKQLMQCVRDF